MPHIPAWFDIPTADFDRAKRFYETICGFELQEMEGLQDGRRAALFPADWQKGEIGGDIAYGEDMKPSAEGVLIYLSADPDMQVVLDRVESAGGKVIMPKMAIGMEGAGHMALVMDSEGNRIGLHSRE